MPDLSCAIHGSAVRLLAVSRTGTRQTRTAVETMVPVVYPVETMDCGPSSPLNRHLGYYKTVGYRYMEEPFTETTTVQGKAPGLLERAAGVAMAGLSSAVFGGLLPEMTGRQDAALGAVSGSVLGKSGTPSGKYQVGAYQDIKGVEGLDAHHVGQKVLMKKLVADYDELTAPAINIPKLGHTKRHPERRIVSRSTKGITDARRLLARDLFELKRVYPDIPNSALKELIDMNEKMYPEMRK